MLTYTKSQIAAGSHFNAKGRNVASAAKDAAHGIQAIKNQDRSIARLYKYWYRLNKLAEQNADTDAELLTIERVKEFLAHTMWGGDLEITDERAAYYRDALKSKEHKEALNGYLSFWRADNNAASSIDELEDEEMLQRFIDEFLQLKGFLSTRMLKLVMPSTFVFNRHPKNWGLQTKIGANLMRLIKIRTIHGGLLYENFNFNGIHRRFKILDKDIKVTGTCSEIPNVPLNSALVVDIPQYKVPSCSSAIGDWMWKARQYSGATFYNDFHYANCEIGVKQPTYMSFIKWLDNGLGAYYAVEDPSKSAEIVSGLFKVDSADKVKFAICQKILEKRLPHQEAKKIIDAVKSGKNQVAIRAAAVTLSLDLDELGFKSTANSYATEHNRRQSQLSSPRQRPLSELLVKCRGRRTLKEAATATKMSATLISQYEKGQTLPSDEALMVIEKAYETELKQELANWAKDAKFNVLDVLKHLRTEQKYIAYKLSHCYKPKTELADYFSSLRAIIGKTIIQVISEANKLIEGEKLDQETLVLIESGEKIPSKLHLRALLQVYSVSITSASRLSTEVSSDNKAMPLGNKTFAQRVIDGDVIRTPGQTR